MPTNYTTTSYHDGYDLTLALPSRPESSQFHHPGEFGPFPVDVHVEVHWTVDICEEDDPGDYETPPSYGVYIEGEECKILAVELYDDTGHIADRREFESAPAADAAVVPDWCPLTPDQLVDQIQAQVDDLDDRHKDADYTGTIAAHDRHWDSKFDESRGL